METLQHINVEIFSTGFEDKAFIERWIELEENSLEYNMFLSPYFVLPSLKYLSPNITPHFITATSSENRLIALAILQESTHDRSYPFRHFEGYSSEHTFLQGMLIDKTSARDAIYALIDFLKHEYSNTPIKFNNIPGDGDQFNYLKECLDKLEGSWIQYDEQHRAILSLKERRYNYFIENFNSKHRNDFRRRKRRLKEIGSVEWRIFDDPIDCQRCVDDFLKLEHTGWKKKLGTSLLSTEHNQKFFIKMASGFLSSNKMICTELLLNGKAISATSNYISGNAIFAFKLGWDVAYKKYAPCAIDLYEFTKYLINNDTGYEYIDSGSEEGSYIEKIWKDQRTLISGFITFGPMPSMFLQGINKTRYLLRRFIPS
ncbi:MAG: GNAT family N-acetyltransferase [Candidatus Thiodiazotropha sp. (ex Monitilora ramsayi)]|nr:GNAT family N-acetyltransferase [Candidatus Thiodiazotropha sp. (ex Monitilora ramsayi)]